MKGEWAPSNAERVLFYFELNISGLYDSFRNKDSKNQSQENHSPSGKLRGQPIGWFYSKFSYYLANSIL